MVNQVPARPDLLVVLFVRELEEVDTSQIPYSKKSVANSLFERFGEKLWQSHNNCQSFYRQTFT